MNKLATLFGTVLIFSSFSMPAQSSETGIGIIIGEPTGLSAKHWLNKTTAIDAAAAWGFSGRDTFHVHADYLLHNFQVFKGSKIKGQLPIHYGLGLSTRLREKRHDDSKSDFVLGVRAPIGITWIVPQQPLDVFIELVPELELAPDTDFGIGLGLGARYYFK